MSLPDFSYENCLWKEGYAVIGIDEVGRGAFAGSVGVGAVMFPQNLKPKDKKYLLSLGINDSKKLSPKKRSELSYVLKQLCTYELAFIDVLTINKIGIGKATTLGMQKVAEKISKNTLNPYLLIDAFKIPGFDNQQGIIRGDCLSISIAAASIIAKVERDALMVGLSLQYKKYGFERNKGYGTKFHRDNIYKFGLSNQHRTVFCCNALNQQIV